MKIITGRVNWRDRWANRPILELLVDHIPNLDAFVFTEREGFYYAELDGEVRFFLDSSCGRGFGGRSFKLKMENGTRTLKGPWSSRPSIANKFGFGPCIDILFADSKKNWYKSNFIYGNCTADLVKDFQNLIRIGDGIYSVGGHGEDFKFPYNSTFTLAKYIQDEEIFYEPAVRLPDGNVWAKAGLNVEVEGIL